MYKCALVFVITFAIAIVAIYIASFDLKQQMAKNDSLTAKSALEIDSLQLVVFSVFFVTLIAALIVFKVLEKRHSMRIKRLELCVAILLGLSSLLVQVL